MLIPNAITSLDEFLSRGPYVSYTYGYPHKTAYRTLQPTRTLRDVWQGEKTDALSLYVHIPFCEMRCGFCNLFTLSQPQESMPKAFLATLEREMQVVQRAIPDARFSRLALGGGTPTVLTPEELHELFEALINIFKLEVSAIPISVETSPARTDADRLAVLRQFSVDRLSIGVQSFDLNDMSGIGRPQKNADVIHAIELARSMGFPIINLDLIYGGDGQTVKGWLNSVKTAAAFQPEEIYLYPLYVRPLTGLSRIGLEPVDDRLEKYRAGRDYLLAQGYDQVSMRMFRKPNQIGKANAGSVDGPVYCCQQDGMVGLGCGARSYTSSLHYAHRFAVNQNSVKEIIEAYIAQNDQQLGTVSHGLVLDNDESARRDLLLSLLQVDGLNLSVFEQRFGDDPLSLFPQLEELLQHGLATKDGSCFRLTDAGLEQSDAIGPWLYSPNVRQLMEEFAWTEA